MKEREGERKNKRDGKSKRETIIGLCDKRKHVGLYLSKEGFPNISRLEKFPWKKGIALFFKFDYMRKKALKFLSLLIITFPLVNWSNIFLHVN